MLHRIPAHRRAAATAVTLALSAIVTPVASGQGAGYWHTSGNKILDSNGSEVRIAGVNWYGFETPDYLVHGLWAQDYKTVLNDIKSLGFNVIRIPFSNQMVESDPVPTNFTQNANGVPVNQALVGQTALQDLDTIVSYAGSIGLRVILDNHRSEAGESNESSGLWYTSAYPRPAGLRTGRPLRHVTAPANSRSMAIRRSLGWIFATNRILSDPALRAVPAGPATPRSMDARPA